ncbi:MAG: hypothetical protein QNJ72_16640 [Pleurocapsa sp. MO_226.B13]|nr:hypothetical protein [Pleurocapsa sp. MO_226.B13]
MLQAAITTVDFSLFKYDLIFPQAHWALLLGIILNFNTSLVRAQDNSNSIKIGRDAISEPVTIQGVSGGAIAAQEITQTENTPTGYCDGFASRQPNHILKLDTFFDYLRLEVESSADTTILVRGAGGVWCNDDVDSANPVIEGQWQPGVYQIWVGSYQENSNNDYQIKITGK